MRKRISSDYIWFFRKRTLLWGVVGLFVFVCVGAAAPFVFKTTYAPILAKVETIPEPPKPPPVMHLKTPSPLKSIYMTSCVAGTPSFRKSLIKLIEETEINAVVIDIKDYTGTISFIPEDPALKDLVSTRCFAPDMKEFLKSIHEKGIYIIGRIAVFQDPYLVKMHPELAVKKKSDKTTWKDYKGLSFTDPGAIEVWKHNVAIAKASYDIGFDELNFDYIRFPSDGPMNDIYFTYSDGQQKSDVLERFFAYLAKEMKSVPPSTGSGQGPVISADLFGMVTTNTDDLNIGQILEKALPHFDYIAPMIYPSHYPKDFNGWANPNKYPYELIKYVLNSAVARTIATTTVIALLGEEPISTTTTPLLYRKKSFDAQKIRPWLQDFDYGGNYDIPEVQAQIKATYDAGLTSWMLWSPSNRYTKGALLPATVISE